MVERLNGVQEVPGSNPGSPIFLRWEIFFGLKRFAKMRGFRGFAVRGEFATESLRVAGIVTKMLHSYFVSGGDLDGEGLGGVAAGSGGG